MKLTASVLEIDCESEANSIAARIASIVAAMRRRGVVVAISGGIDSSVSAALAVRALGPSRVFGLLLPEHESSDASLELGRSVAESLQIEYRVQKIGAALEAIGCYEARDAAIRRVFPEYGPGWRSKIVIQSGMQGRVSLFKLVVQQPDGTCHERRLPPAEYLQIVAATNYKQRMRKAVEYFHADRLNYAVIGTPNRLEYDQGFFVKGGDGLADIKPIAHLYKSQVYRMAEHLGLPEKVCRAVPTTDTYSLSQGQDEFFFDLPYQQMDLVLWALNAGFPEQAVAEALGCDIERARALYASIRAKRRAAAYLHAPPMLVTPVDVVERINASVAN